MWMTTAAVCQMVCILYNRLCVNVDVEIPHDEGSPEPPDYQFVKWMTINKVLCSFAILKHCY